MLQMYLVFVISFTPVWTAGKLSEDVQAALGMASQAQLFLNVVCMGLASGATAAISQSLGALRRRRAEPPASAASSPVSLSAPRATRSRISSSR